MAAFGVELFFYGREIAVSEPPRELAAMAVGGSTEPSFWDGIAGW
jgi:hypothetical protein